MKFGKFYFCFSSLLAQQPEPRVEVSNNAREKYKTKELECFHGRAKVFKFQ